jgi:hypothetical protein
MENIGIPGTATKADGTNCGQIVGGSNAMGSTKMGYFVLTYQLFFTNKL